jgi:hypothetical protein
MSEQRTVTERCKWPNCECVEGCGLYWTKLADWEINGCKRHGDRQCKECRKPQEEFRAWVSI